MAFHIAEYANLASDAKGNVIPAPQAPAVAYQTVAIDAASAQSSALNARTRFLRLAATADCHYLIGGSNPSATTSHSFLPAGGVEFIGVYVRTGETVKIAVKDTS